LLVSVVIVNFNGRFLLGDCIAGLEAQTRAPDEVIVVDNGSTDGSVDYLRDAYPWVRIIDARENLGFSAGNNLGIRNSIGELIVLLNNDTLPGPGFVEEIVRPLEEDPALSAVAGVLLFRSNAQFVASAGIDVHSDGLAVDHRLAEPWRLLPARFSVFGPSAGAAAYRRFALLDAGLFPGHYFLYLEDADLAWRLRLQSRVTVGVRAAWVHHIYSASAAEGSPLKDFYLARNRAWTLIRCWPRSLWWRHWWSVARYELLAIGHALATRRWGSIAGRIAGWAGIRRMLSQRRAIQQHARAGESELLYWVRPATSIREALRMRKHVRELVSWCEPENNELER
jgi:GT2 family glycosyltransferase